MFEELTYVEEYLEIEQTRQPSRVDWRMNVEPGCALAGIFFLPRILKINGLGWVGARKISDFTDVVLIYTGNQ